MSLKMDSGSNGGVIPRLSGKIVLPGVELEKVDRHHGGCPHFALFEDPDTSLLFPSPAGCCYRSSPPASPHLTHQQTYCIRSNYRACPVWQSPNQEPLPLELLGPDFEGHLRRRRVLWAIGVLILVGIVALLIYFTEWTDIIDLPGSQVAVQSVPSIAAVAMVPDVMPTHFVGGVISDTLSTASPTPPIMPTLMETAASTPTSTLTPAPSVPATFTAVPPPTSLPSPTLTPQPTPPPTALVDVPFLNVRRGPSTSYEVLQRLEEPGTQFEIVGRNADGDWWQVCCIGGETGWLTAENVTVEGDTSALLVVSPRMPQAMVFVETLNIRTGPGVVYPVFATAVLNDQYDVVARLDDNTWWQICCIDGENGWVFGEGIEIVGSDEFVPVALDLPVPPTQEP